MEQEERENIGTIYSNCDHTFDDNKDDLIAKLKEAPNRTTVGHPAENFFGEIYFNDGKFYEEVWRYGAIAEIFSNEKIENLIEKVNNKFGDD